MEKTALFNQDSPFFIGCNYWASHAGTAMWQDWSPEVVKLDFRRLSAAGITVMRIFPLWPDFQPISTLYTQGGQATGQRHGEFPLPHTAAGRAGMSESMMERFRFVADLARTHGIRLIVGLVTGWMSGRLFVPPALQGRNVITDPEAIRWQIRFVDYFVNATKYHPAIAAWDLGNECNCMGDVADRHQSYLWTASLANAIRRADPDRLIVSGMHSLQPRGKWTMQDQGELTDILTTHPYPFWTEYMDFDPIDSFRPTLHATVESLFYGQIGGKPCFAEEMGTMGPMVCSETVAAAFARTSLLSQWANDLPGLLWWCASDQTRLQHSPYDSSACENELGLITEDGRVKPVLGTLAATCQKLARLPFGRLPERQVEAVCILNTQQDHWATALGSFMLAKQGGFDLRFCFEDQELPDAPLYLLPCVTGVGGVPKQLWLTLLEKVRLGATLWISSNNGYLLNFQEITGMEVANRRRRAQPARVRLSLATTDEAADRSGGLVLAEELSIPATFRLDFTPHAATVLATETDGNPVWTESAHGQGTVHFFSLPLELAMSTQAETSYRPAEQPYWQVYRRLSAAIRARNRVMEPVHPLVAVTEHVQDDEHRVAVLVNHSPAACRVQPRFREGWRIVECLYGSPEGSGSFETLEIAANDGLVLGLACGR